MAEQEYEDFCTKLKAEGFSFSSAPLNGANGYWYKGYRVLENEEHRRAYQIMFLVYDFHDFGHRSEYLRKSPYSIQKMVMLSRTSSERTDLLLTDNDLDLRKLEAIAENFYKWWEGQCPTVED